MVSNWSLLVTYFVNWAKTKTNLEVIVQIIDGATATHIHIRTRILILIIVAIQMIDPVRLVLLH